MSALVPFLTCVGFPLSAHLPVFDEHITNESDDDESGDDEFDDDESTDDESEQEAVDRDDVDVVGTSRTGI